MKFEYNLVKLFSLLPQDMIRAILEFDDTYHRTFRTEIFKEQLVHMFWKQSFIKEAVDNMVFSHLENIVKTRRTFMRPANIYVIMAGRMETKHGYRTIGDMRNEIRIVLSPYRNYLRWKMVPKMDNDHANKPWDGCIGNSVNDPRAVWSLLFGAGNVGGQVVKYVTPSAFGHIGDTFWF